MNYWIFQSNPLKFPIKQEIINSFSDRLPTEYRGVNTWHIEKIPKKMRPGDIIFIWKSDGGEQDTRGIYALGRVISIPPHREPLTPARINAKYKEAGLYLDWFDSSAEKNKEQWPTVVMEYTRSLLQKPLLARDIAKVPELKNLLILRFWQKTLFDDLKEDQGNVILGKIGDHSGKKTELGLSADDFVEEIRKLLQRYDQRT